MKLVRRMLRGLAIGLATCGLIFASLAAEPTPKHVRLLAIGNSFSQNATHYLPGIVEAAGDKLTFRTISIGGCPLERHWKNADAFQHGSVDPLARAWTALIGSHATHVLVHEHAWLDDQGARTTAALTMLGGREIFRDGTEVLIKLP